jgi:hypothetical protein
VTLKILLRITGLLEGGTALAFLLLPAVPLALLFGPQPVTAIESLLGRVLGASLLSLAMICWWVVDEQGSRATSGVVGSMVIYDIAAVALLLYARRTLKLSGVALGPVVIVHTVLAAWSVLGTQRKKST